jgi:hypothetical protein
MKTKKLAWILAGSSAVAGAVLGLAACSGDDTKPITTKDSGLDSTTGDSGKDTSTTDGPTTDTGADAAACFSKLRPAPDAGPFCYFIPKANDAGNGVNCATGETCCYGAPKGPDAGFDPSSCVGGGAAACPAPTTDASPGDSFECAEKDDCPSNQSCCIVALDGADGGAVTMSTGVDKFTCTFLKGEKGTRCKATCGSGDFQGCQSDSECGSKKCILINVGTGDRLQMGYCN